MTVFMAVCVPCRRTYKGGGRATRIERPSDRPRWFPTSHRVLPERCPECGAPLITADSKWRPPRRSNDRAWRRVAAGDYLWENDRD